MKSVSEVTGTSVEDLAASFLRSLRAENKSDRTVETYGDACRGFARFLAEKGMPTAVDAISREHVEAFIDGLLRRWKPATAANRYRVVAALLRVRYRRGRDHCLPHAEHVTAEGARIAP